LGGQPHDSGLAHVWHWWVMGAGWVQCKAPVQCDGSSLWCPLLVAPVLVNAHVSHGNTRVIIVLSAQAHLKMF
jgi:hypothetical protein